MGSLAEAHQADAEYRAALGNYAGAVASLKLALRETDSEGYLAQSITARLQGLEEKLALQLRMQKS
jgi:predicted Zn-dependent protease